MAVPRRLLLRPRWIAALLLCVPAFVGGHGVQAARPSLQHPSLAERLEEGRRAVVSGDPRGALDVFTAALPEAEQSGDAAVLAASLSGLGWAQWATGEYTTSLATRARALDLYRTLGDIPQQTAVLKGLGETLYSLGRYDEALARYGDALASEGRAPDAAQKGLILSNIGSAYRSLGKYAEALTVLQQSVDVLRPLGKPGVLSQPYTFLGMVSRALGEFDRAAAFYEEALRLARADGNRRHEAQVLGNMGNVYFDLGRNDRALELYRQSLALAHEIRYTAQEGFDHQNIAGTLNALGRPAEALPHFREALAIARGSNRRSQVGWTLLNLAVLYMHRADPADAVTALEEALGIGRELKESSLEAFALMDLAELDANAGQAARAVERYDAALTIARTSHEADLEYQILWGRGAARHRQGRLDEAIDDLEASVRIASDLRAHVSTDQSKIAFMDTRQAAFQELASVLADAGRVEESFAAAEALRARALADLMSERQVRGRPEEEPALAQLRSVIARSAPEDAIAAALAGVRQQNRELASLVSAESPDAAEARRIAARLDATVVEYLVTDDSVLAYVIAGDSIRVQRTSVSRGHLRDTVSTLLARLNAPAADGVPDRRVRLALRELHGLLIEPIRRWLPAQPRASVVIVPHDALSLVPFDALTARDGSMLIDRHTLTYAPALSIFRYTALPHDEAAHGSLIVSDPLPPRDSGLERLPASRDEGLAVRRRLHGEPVLLLSGAGARESAVKRAAGSRRVIHFATHGLVSELRPLASALLLTAGDGEDGYLRADEVFGLRLNADLVVLSGCSTGTGRLTGDGILGLSRSFLYAGASSLVVSYWDVSDVATLFLMDRFYAALGRGASKASALREAEIATRHRYPHPAHWAAFALVGEPS